MDSVKICRCGEIMREIKSSDGSYHTCKKCGSLDIDWKEKSVGIMPKGWQPTAKLEINSPGSSAG